MKEAEDPGDPPSPEYLAMQLVADESSIPIPAVRRCIRRRYQEPLPEELKEVYQSDYAVWYRHFLAMQYIEARPLSLCWPLLSWWNRFRVIWTLRQYISQLRRIESPFSNRPGPIGHSTARVPLGQIWRETPLSFETPEALAENFTWTIPLKDKYGNPVPIIPFPDPSPLVLTHADLHLSNILLDNSGRLWLIDWGHSGYYPVWFEYLTAVTIAYSTKAPDSWRLLLPLITGPSFAHESWAEDYNLLFRWSSEDTVGLNILWLRLRRWFGASALA